MMEQDLIEAKKYLSEQGYGSGTNYTTNLVAVLLANYAQDQLKKFRLGAVMPSLPNGTKVLEALKELRDSFTDEERETMFGNEA
jgi:hypothetical protein